MTKQELKEKEKECKRISHDLEVQREKMDREITEKIELIAKKDMELAEKVKKMTKAHEAARKEIQENYEAQLQAQLEAMKEEKKQNETELLVTHQQAMDIMKNEVQMLRKMNTEKDARLLQLEQQQMEVCR